MELCRTVFQIECACIEKDGSGRSEIKRWNSQPGNSALRRSGSEVYGIV